MSSQERKQKIWNLIEDIQTGMLVSNETGGDEQLHARPMSLVQDEQYFCTSKNDAKAFEVKNDNDVCITFSEPKNQTYVSMTGRAKLTENKDLIDKYWNSWVSAWFENGKDNPEVAMLEIKINKDDHWNAEENKFVRILEMVKANVKADVTPDIGEYEKFGS